MITVRLLDPDDASKRLLPFSNATRISTDEHNNLEIWGGDEGDDLLYVVAEAFWIDVSVEAKNTNGTNTNRNQ